MKDWLNRMNHLRKNEINTENRGKAGALVAEESSSSVLGFSKIARVSADFEISRKDDRSIAANGWVADLLGSFEVNQFSNIF